MSKYGKPYYKVLRVKTEPSDYFWIQNVSGNDNQFFIFWKQGNPSGKVEYSKDKTNWVKVTEQYTYIYFDNNEKVYFRSTNGFSSSDSSYYYFNLQCDVNAGGNIGRLVDWTEDLINLPDFSFYRLIDNGNNLKDISQLTFGTIKKIGRFSCKESFRNIYSTGAPDFSSIEEISEQSMAGMFAWAHMTSTGDFSSLKTVGQYGMREMFYNNTTLQEIGDFSSLESIGLEGMRSMFSNCYSAPMTTGMDLSNVTSVGSYGLSSCYNDCYHITEVTAPNIQDLTVNGILNNWMSGAGTQASGTKTVFVPTGATIFTNSTNGIPNGWTRVDY